MLETAYRGFVEAAAVMYTVILDTPLFFIDLWSFAHLASGAILAVILLRRHTPSPFSLLFLILCGYEALELWLTWAAIHVFLPETLPDQVTDIAIGLVGGMLGLGLWRWWRDCTAAWRRTLVRDAIVAGGLAAVWVASFGYRYNVGLFNTPGLNWMAWLLWSAGLFGALRIERGLRRALAGTWTRAGATWAVFLVGLLAVEYIGYHVVHLRLLTSEGPLVFGLIHGPPRLKAFYVVAAPLALLVRAALPAEAERGDLQPAPRA